MLALFFSAYQRRTRMLALFFSTSVPSPKQQHRIEDARPLLLRLRPVAQGAVLAASNRPDRRARTWLRSEQGERSGGGARGSVPARVSALTVCIFIQLHCTSNVGLCPCRLHSRTWKWRWNYLIPLRLPIYIIYSLLKQRSEWRSGSVLGP
jgi:hypothetical protein